MAVTVHNQVAEVTKKMEDAVYAALDAIDAYDATMQRLASEQESADEPNEMLLKRLAQFRVRAQNMARIIEDDVLMEMLFCVDRLFAVELAERGEFI